MQAVEKLALLKSNLQLLTSAHDDYLQFLLKAAEAAIQREGIKDDGSIDYVSCVIDYAAYLFRKRASGTSGAGGFAPDGGETAMPRFLRYQLNNILFAQKTEASHDV